MPVIPVEYVMAWLRPTWRELEFGLEQGFVAPGSATVYVRTPRTRSGPSSPAAVNGEREPLAEERIARRWYLIALLYLSESTVERPISHLEEIYDRLDHPEELEQFLPFTPARRPELARKRSREENIRALEVAWRDWASESRARWQKALDEFTSLPSG